MLCSCDHPWRFLPANPTWRAIPEMKVEAAKIGECLYVSARCPFLLDASAAMLQNVLGGDVGEIKKTIANGHREIKSHADGLNGHRGQRYRGTSERQGGRLHRRRPAKSPGRCPLEGHTGGLRWDGGHAHTSPHTHTRAHTVSDPTLRPTSSTQQPRERL